MYQKLSASELKQFLKLENDYKVDGLLTFGTYRKDKAYRYLDEALAEIGEPFKFEVLQSEFFCDVKVLTTPYGRFWFDAIYGCAYASELAHFASVLGARAIIHVGSFGSLQPNIQTGDIIVPERAIGNESTTRMYSGKEDQNIFFADKKICGDLKKIFGLAESEKAVVSVQAMMAETEDDVAQWHRSGYAGVEMECASLFAVAEHFKVPVAAVLYAADNLVNKNLVTDGDYQKNKDLRDTSRQRSLVAALRYILKNT